MFDARFFQLKVASLTSCWSSRIANRIKHHRFTPRYILGDGEDGDEEAESNDIWIREQQMFHVPCSNWISNPDLIKRHNHYYVYSIQDTFITWYDMH
jgi:hypothetical protein